MSEKKKMKKAFVSIDPGLSGWGYAIFSAEGADLNRVQPPLEAGSVTPPSKVNKLPDIKLGQRLGHYWDDLNERLEAWTTNYNLQGGVVEWPEFFGTSAKGHTAASKGDLTKLTCSAAGIVFALASYGLPCQPIGVRKWKGQLSKDLVIHRIQKILPDFETESHAWDAVGLGLHFKKVAFK